MELWQEGVRIAPKDDCHLWVAVLFQGHGHVRKKSTKPLK
jgi:hypothetical protein